MASEQREQDVNGGAEPTMGTPRPTPPPSSSVDTARHDPVMIVLSYLGLLALIPYLTVKNDDFIRWHAKQGLTLMGVSIGVMVAVVILGTIMALIPYIGFLIVTVFSLATSLLALGLFGLCLVALIKGLGGERWKIPIVGDISERW